MGFILRFPAYFCVTSCILVFYIAIAARKFNAIERKMIGDLCSSNETVTYALSGNGVQSALQFVARHDFQSREDKICAFIIDTDSDKTGVIVRVDSSYNTGLLYKQCDNYFQVSMPKDIKNFTKLCGFKHSSFVSEGKAIIQYHEKHSVIPGRGFPILVTAYRRKYEKCYMNEFMCYTGECIWNGFVCDGMENCPDGSDEFESGESFCIDVPIFTLKPVDFDWNADLPTAKNISQYRKSFNVTVAVAIAAAALILLFGIIRFVFKHFCSGHLSYVQRQEVLRRLSVIRSRPDFQAQFNCPLPSYSFLSSETMNSNPTCTSPPPYSSEPASENSCVVLLSNTNKDVQQNCVIDPPPAYEP